MTLRELINQVCEIKVLKASSLNEELDQFPVLDYPIQIGNAAYFMHDINPEFVEIQNASTNPTPYIVIKLPEDALKWLHLGEL